jgi:signal transduction histidine kinase
VLNYAGARLFGKLREISGDAARVELTAGPRDLELTVEDGGRGFDAAKLKGTSRLGILGMRERVDLLGGEFELETAPGRGTRIHVRLPLPGD